MKYFHLMSRDYMIIDLDPDIQLIGLTRLGLRLRLPLTIEITKDDGNNFVDLYNHNDDSAAVKHSRENIHILIGTGNA